MDRVGLGVAESGRPPPLLGSLRFLAYFKLSIAVLLTSLVAGWFLRQRLLVWLVSPTVDGWSHAPSSSLHFGTSSELCRVYLILVLTLMWIPAVPFMASDVWRLLRARMPPRAARLRLAFALASGLVAIGVLLLIRQYAKTLFATFVPLDVEI